MKVKLTDLESARALRRKETGEDFTPIELINIMLDKLNLDWSERKTFLEPAAGDGNFVVEIFKRKVAAGQDPLIALSDIYAVELLQDNVNEMKTRLLELIESKSEALSIMDKNIVCASATEWDFTNWRHIKGQLSTKLF